MKGIGHAIRSRRQHLNISQEELAELSGIQKSDISTIENGRRENITLKTLEAFSVALQCRPSELLEMISSDLQTSGTEETP
ncbi:helix-turn-helix domain-containing protein [Deinococcus roseus]|uniref:HTH cro/C1-type domain-containing protein n=1 Tax=Deinococcus roseus TaxID=392414 RepID=A0ABQ2DCK7_9DEIO|nr:hypothetical protein GCM10008938_43930 [Deinococcus roseus]